MKVVLLKMEKNIMKKLIVIALVFSACLVFAVDEQSILMKRLDSYQTQMTDLSSNLEKLTPEEINSILNGRQAPYAILYENTGLYEWQLLPQCYYDYDTDTTNSVININVEYKPNDDYFSTIPVYFFLNTKRPYDLDNYKNLMITAFKSVGTDIIVLYNKVDTKYGYPGFHYCQSFTYSSARWVIDSYFLIVDDVVCVVYYMTNSSFYGNILYQMFFDLILDILEFNNSSGATPKSAYEPINFKLNQNYPNPFNDNTIINYSIAKPSHIKLEIYDSTGRKVKTLFDKYHDVGNYSITFDASGLSSGVYIYRLLNNEGYKSHQMLLIK